MILLQFIDQAASSTLSVRVETVAHTARIVERQRDMTTLLYQSYQSPEMCRNGETIEENIPPHQ